MTLHKERLTLLVTMKIITLQSARFPKNLWLAKWKKRFSSRLFFILCIFFLHKPIDFELAPEPGDDFDSFQPQIPPSDSDSEPISAAVVSTQPRSKKIKIDTSSHSQRDTDSTVVETLRVPVLISHQFLLNLFYYSFHEAQHCKIRISNHSAVRGEHC